MNHSTTIWAWAMLVSFLFILCFTFRSFSITICINFLNEIDIQFAIGFFFHWLFICAFAFLFVYGIFGHFFLLLNLFVLFPFTHKLLNDSQRAAQIETVEVNDKQNKTKEHQFGLHFYLIDTYCVAVSSGGGMVVLLPASKHTIERYRHCNDA